MMPLDKMMRVNINAYIIHMHSLEIYILELSPGYSIIDCVDSHLHAENLSYF